jgi:hypothetical protein
MQTNARNDARLCSMALVLLSLMVCAADAQADEATTSQAAKTGDNSDSGGSNSANDPTEPRFTLQYWNYYATSLNQQNGGAENGVGRILIPFKIDGVQQIMHIDPSVATETNVKSGPRIGLGDTQFYNFTLAKFDVGLPEKVTFGLGPLIVVPTANSTAFGPSSFQGGVAGVILARQKWGMLGVLATYQHTLSGASTELTTVQPIIYYNLANGYYLRSSGIMNFDTYGHTSTVPIGFGVGKVIQLHGGYTLNVYAEAQPSVDRAGEGAPKFQVYTGIQVQFP